MTRTLKQGFTLVELIMVVAIIALVASLAVTRISGYRLNAQKKLSLANQTRVASAVDAYLAAGGKLNWLDNPLDYTASGGTGGRVSSDNAVLLTGNGASNLGLNPTLRAMLGTYALSAADVAALAKLGLKAVFAGLTGNGTPAVGDGDIKSWGEYASPMTCCSVAVTNKPGMLVAAVNPHAGGYTGGYLVYQACGQDVQYVRGGISVQGKTYTQFDSVWTPGARGETESTVGSGSALKSGEGLLLAFGLGCKASLVGSNQAGIDTAPSCPLVNPGEYPRYLLLIRLRQTGQQAVSSVVAEFAGVIDALGQGRVMANWNLDKKN